MTTTHRCGATGLHLISDPGIYGYHVGKNDYPPLSAATRDAAAKWRQAWGRYDVPGQTFYLAETRECAYAEVLSQYKRANGTSDTLAKDAAAVGLTLQAFVEEVAQEWSERDSMGLGALPAGWRYDRGMIPAVMPDPGWLVHVEHPDSIAAIESMMGAQLAAHGVAHLTTGTLRGEERSVTTAIAEHLHGLTLDTGGRPLGIHFGSKHGAGWCKAIWLDHPDAGDILTLSPEPITLSDDDLIAASDRFRIRIF